MQYYIIHTTWAQVPTYIPYDFYVCKVHNVGTGNSSFVERTPHGKLTQPVYTGWIINYDYPDFPFLLMII